MTTDATISERFPFLSEHIESLRQQYRLSFRGDGVTVSNQHLSIHFRDADLQSLENGRKATTPTLTYHIDCGISIGTYSEFFVQLGHPDYLYLDAGEWPGDKPLQFLIGNILVIVGEASPLIALLMEPVFRDSDSYPEGFGELASIQLIGPNHDQARHTLSNALYYLNSHYLRPIGLFAKLHKVSVDFDDPLGLIFGENDFSKMFARVLRARTRKRTDYVTIEPLALYNYAAQASNIEQFLSFYRVLEFFTNRSAIASIDKMRRDQAVPSSDILKFTVAKNEESLLIQLVQNVLTSSQKKKLISYSYNNRLLTDTTPATLAKALYAFRNSVIHAKEVELAKTMVPDPFRESEPLEKWTYIVRFIAERSIRKLNT